MRKLWGGAFEVGAHGRVDRFGGSIESDLRFWREDVLGSIAHARMLGAVGVLTADESGALISGLEKILSEGADSLPRDVEDVHTAVEVRLGELVGPVAGKLHTARSRNDQVATDAKLFLRSRGDELQRGVKALQEELLRQADREKTTLAPGYTHQQPAQPITLGFHLLAHFWALQRDGWRLGCWQTLLGSCPLGSAALAGTGFPIDREVTARELGFAAPAPNALDATSDRSWALDGLHVAASLMLTLSRLAQEIVLWSGAEFGFVRLSDAVTTGSSIMPQKRNPDMAELIRGRTGKAIGTWTAFAATMKALPLGYNRDTQDDKPALFEALDLAEDALALCLLMLEGAEWQRARLKTAAGSKFSYATDLADLLAVRGLPFREAHEVVGSFVRRAEGLASAKLRAAIDAELADRGLAPFTDAEARVFNPAECVRRRESLGGPGPAAMRKQMGHARRLWTAPGFARPF